MNITALHRTATALPLIAMLALAGCGGGGGGGSTAVGVGPDVPATPVDMGIREIDVSQFLNTAIDQGTAPGMIAAIIDENGVSAIGASGVRRQGSPEMVTINDLVRIGSETKAMTSTMLATLVQDGTFANGWNTTIVDVFPELAGAIHQDYHAVTLSQLVRMQSGIALNPVDWQAHSNNPDITERRYNILRDNLSDPPAGPAGDHLYSNLSYLVASAMAEQLTGKSWETLIEERLFAPLGIVSFGYGPPAAPGDVNQPSGHTPDGSGGWTPSLGDDDASGAPAGSNLHMTIEDWAKFISLWFPDKEPAILNRGLLNELSTPESGSYAAGWRVRSWNNGTVMFHTGTAGGWKVSLWIVPDRGVAYVAVANASSPEVDELLDSIISDLVVTELQSHEASAGAQDHVIQVAQQGSRAVSAIRDSGSNVIGLQVGDTTVSLDFHRLEGVSGGSPRPAVGSVLQNDDIRVRHVHSHWDMVTDVVSTYEYLSFGAWATVAPETGGDARFDYRYESIGDGYLAALDSTRTPAANMAISGAATYSGQYTGFAQGHGADGDIVSSTGDADITADFANASLSVEMLSARGTAFSLSGSILGNTFSGTTLEHFDTNSLIQVTGATATMEGGFYGAGASEAGGVFEVIGGRPQDPGRFVGAFGGKKAD